MIRIRSRFILTPLFTLSFAVACGSDDDGGGNAGASAGKAGTAGTTSKGGASGSGGASSGTGGTASGTGGTTSGTSGSGGKAGAGTAGNASAGQAGSGTGGAGQAGGGTAGSGTAGSGTAGSGTAGSGTAGSGTAGSGTAGSGTAGSGQAGSGTAGTSSGSPTKGYGACGAKSGRFFPEASFVYRDVRQDPVRTESPQTTKWLKDNGGWGTGQMRIDASIVVNDAGASPTMVTRENEPGVDYIDDCDAVPMPIPAGARIEGHDDTVCPGRLTRDEDLYEDCHLIVVDDKSGRLFESYYTTYQGGKLLTDCIAAWDMKRDYWGKAPPIMSTWGRGQQCTSADAAGFPIAPLLFTVAEIKAGAVDHAIRFILPNARMRARQTNTGKKPYHVWPATHGGGPSSLDPVAPIYGSWWRLKDAFDPAQHGLDANNQVVKVMVATLKKHGMLLSDGGNIALTAASDAGCQDKWEDVWGDDGSRVLAGIEPEDFDVLDTGPAIDTTYECVRTPY